MVIYIKENSQINLELFISSKHFEFSKVNIMFSFKIQFFELYKAPSVLNIELTVMLEKEIIPNLNTSKPFIIMGDFNLDIHGKHWTLLQKSCRTFACEMLMNGPTTDNISTLNLAFFPILAVTLEQLKHIAQITSLSISILIM